jgi:hypothetical protein
VIDADTSACAPFDYLAPPVFARLATVDKTFEFVWSVQKREREREIEREKRETETERQRETEREEKERKEFFPLSET